MQRIALCMALALCLLSLPALADEPRKPNRLDETFTMELSPKMLALIEAADADKATLTTYTTGFEPEEGYAPGFIEGQAGWTSYDDGSIIEPSISDGAPLDGTQHLRFGFDPIIPPGVTALAAIGPDSGDQSGVAVRSSLRIDVKIDGLGGADYEVLPTSPSQGLIATRVDFSYLGTILVADFVDGSFQFIDTGVPWKLDEYGELRVDLDPTKDLLEYYYDGELIYTSTAGVLGATIIERALIFSDNFNLSDVGDFDNLEITIEPTAVAVPTLGQVGMVVMLLSMLGFGIFRLRQR